MMMIPSLVIDLFLAGGLEGRFLDLPSGFKLEIFCLF